MSLIGNGNVSGLVGPFHPSADIPIINTASLTKQKETINYRI